MAGSSHTPGLTRFAWLSVGAAVVTIALKTIAYFLTGSVGLLSDALESVVNLVAAAVALWALSVAAQPPDDDHTYGHDKAEYLSSGAEGALIIVAAISILVTAVQRLIIPQSLQEVDLGLGVSLVATLVNFVVARILLRAGRQHHSITLEADAKHLMTDVWTSVGVIVGLILTVLTGWIILDAVIALLVGLNIVISGVQLMRRSTLGLLDTAIPTEERAKVLAIMERYRREGVEFHALRSRQSGARRFVSFHVLVPDAWTVRRGHDLLERIEEQVRQELPNVHVFTHLEPLHDPVSWQDTRLDRGK